MSAHASGPAGLGGGPGPGPVVEDGTGVAGAGAGTEPGVGAAVTVVGAGIAGLACARALADRGVAVRVLDRGRRPGGRLASRTIDGRQVDIGAGYAAAPEGSPFAEVVADWVARGLVRRWTDTFAVADADGILDHTSGPMRYGAPGGWRAVSDHLASGLGVVSGRTVERVAAGLVDAERAGEVVLAMPDPQASRLVSGILEQRLAEVAWEPVITVVLSWEARAWPADLHGAFVNGSADVGFIADDGDRRGDGAPVLVAHSTAALARAHLTDPDGAVPAVQRAVQRILGISDAPARASVHRWTFARPERGRAEPFAREDGVAVCGDAWGGAPSVRTAWASGDALGRSIADDLG